MKYLSIDTETGGLDPQLNTILEIGAIVEDTALQLPREQCPQFHFYIWSDNIVGNPYALAMNYKILQKIVQLKKEGSSLLKTYETVGAEFARFLHRNFGIDDVTLAGKNLGTFDLRFLEQIPGWDDLDLHRRNLDPTLHFIDWNKDGCPPDLNTCKERAGIPGSVTHEALDDAWDVIELLRKVACQRQTR
jgi:oligoribonuclease